MSDSSAAATRPAAPVRVAVLWDLENLQATAFDVTRGVRGAYSASIRARGQAHRAPFLKLGAVSNKLQAVVGPVAVNRAYADWGLFRSYNEEVIAHAIMPCHVPQLGGMKNAADIRLAVDAVELLTSHPHVTHFVIASNDSDFCSVAQHLRMAGKTVIGLGTEGRRPVNHLWRKACDQFVTIPAAAFGHTPPKPAPKPAPGPAPAPALSKSDAYLKELSERFHVVVPPSVVRHGLFDMVVRGFAAGEYPAGKNPTALDAYLQHLFAQHGRPLDRREVTVLRQLLSVPHLLGRTETRWDLPPEVDAARMEVAFRAWAKAKLANTCGAVDEAAFDTAMAA